MKKVKILFILLAVTLLTSCEGVKTDYKNVDYQIRGTWESADPSQYSGQIVIDSDTITIIGYEEDQTPLFGDDSKRPFRNFAKGVPLTCWTDNGNLIIQTVGGAQSLPYLYSTNLSDRFIRFSFGGREEGLIRTGN